jgi:amino acid adenylation domain-containing protein
MHEDLIRSGTSLATAGRDLEEAGAQRPGPIAATYPLSAIQNGMLYHSLAAEGSGLYVQQMMITMPEELEIDRFRQAWERVMSRHAILRTSFNWKQGEPRQDVYASVPVPLKIMDESHQTPDLQEKILADFIESDRKAGFDLGDLPCWRVTVFRFSSHDIRCVWTFHHILLDGRSHTLLLDEVFSNYDTPENGIAPEEASVRPYREYIDWLDDRNPKESEEFWRNNLAGLTSPTCLGIGPSRHGDEAALEEHAYQELKLSVEQTDSLRAFAAANDLTLNTLVQGAWALLLSRYNDSDDVIFGTTRACRHWSGEDTETMVGLFVNTLPFRVRCRRGETVLSLLREIRKHQVALRPHEHAPLTQVQGWSEIPRGVALFDSILVFENYMLSSHFKKKGGPWLLRDVDLLEKVNYLALAAYAEKELHLKLEYDKNRFGHVRMDLFLGHLDTILNALPGFRDSTIDKVPMLTPGEMKLIAGEWSGRTGNFPDDICFHRLFEKQVATAPGAIAMEYGGQRFSYDQLNRRANRLARRIRSLEIDNLERVGVCMERSLDMVVAMLAIFKAGAAYVPIDPASPRERVAYYIEDSGIDVVLTHEALASNIPREAPPLLLVDRERDGIDGEDDSNLKITVLPDDIAYILYTSGSTGRPKGVLTEHRGLCNMTEAQVKVFRLTPESRVLQFSNPDFDVSLYEITMALRVGATLCTGSFEEMLPGPALVEFMRTARINAVTLTPTVLRAMPQAELPDLKLLVCCGEACPEEIIDQWAQDRRFINAYGPTEVSVWSTWDECRPGGGRPTIGRPIDNLVIYILDACMKPVPTGVPGELFIGGVGLAKGYLNRPGLTAEKFLPNPFSSDPAARLYRTGDLVRFLPDGRIYFIERMDNQVKVQGVRIELGEIESVLRGHHAVEEAVVLFRDDRLSAFVSPAVGEEPDREDLRLFMGETLPHYLVPSLFTVLDTIPRALSGKVDRAALARVVEEDTPGSICDAPDRKLTDEERHRVLVEWNRTDTPFPNHLCAHDLVGEAAARKPAAEAVRRGEQTLTYAELEKRSNELAHRLRETGIGKEDLVAVFMERSIEAVIGFYAILKAGGSFVPIDPAAPARRSAWILDDSDARVVITQSRFADNPALQNKAVLTVDSSAAIDERLAAAPPDSRAGPHDRAYVIYTSGSTGRPKGVEIEHHSLANLVFFYQTRLGIEADDRSSLLANVTFDASIADIWPYLAAGASVRIPEGELLSDPGRLKRWIIEEGITISFLPTALGELLLKEEWPDVAPLRYMLTGGDRLHLRPRRGLPFTLLNTYGPTENTVDSTWAVVEPGDGSDLPPIGKPIANVRAYVLDESGEPVPVGASGELHLGGEGVARGYLNRPELTAERFVKAPFNGEAGKRIYRTGDRVRYLPDGDIEFLGRVDNQIQIRGYRVELGEIEEALRRHRQVKDAAVRLLDDRKTAQKLTAWVVTSNDRPDGIRGDLRAFLSDRLPQYMIPTFFTILDAMPRNESGKVDQAALPAPDERTDTVATDKEAPRDTLERDLAGIWEEVLKVSPIARKDNFFDLGGHSLLILPLLAKIREQCGRKLSLATLFQNPTVEQLADLLRDGGQEGEESVSCIVEINKNGRETPIFCTAGMGGGTHWFNSFARHIGSDRPFFGLEPVALSRKSFDKGSIEAMAAECVDALRRVQPHGPYIIGGFSTFGGFIAWEITRQLREVGEEIKLLFLIEAYGPGERTGRIHLACRYACNVLMLSWKEKLLYVRKKIAWIREKISDYWGITRHSPEESRELWDAMALHKQAALSYEAPPRQENIILIRCQRPPYSSPSDPEAGWGQTALGKIRIHTVPGDHYTMFEPPGDRMMADILNRTLK